MSEHKHCHHHHHHNKKISLKSALKYIYKSAQIPEGKWILIYAAILVTSSVYQIILGLTVGQTHNVSEGFHTAFHSLSMFVGLIGFSYSYLHTKPDGHFNYGYERSAVISAFANTILFLFTCLFEIFDTLHVILSQSQSDEDNSISHFLSVYIVLKSAVGLILAFKFQNHVYCNEGSAYGDNTSVLIIHIVGIIVRDFVHMVHCFFEFQSFGNPFIYFRELSTISLLILIVIMLQPYLTRTAKILLLATPTGKQKDAIQKQIREVSLIHGVAEILNEKIWSLTPLKLVGCITLKIYEGYNASLIVEQAREQLSPFFDTLYIEIASCQSTKT